MSKTIKCTIVTPNEAVLDGHVNYASIPSWDGQLGIMHGGSPIMGKLGTGTLRLDFPEGGSRWYMLDGGFAQFRNDELNLLSDDAIQAETISLSEAEAELVEANSRVTLSKQDQNVVERQQARAMAKISLAKAHSSRGGAI